MVKQNEKIKQYSKMLIEIYGKLQYDMGETATILGYSRNALKPELIRHDILVKRHGKRKTPIFAIRLTVTRYND